MTRFALNRASAGFWAIAIHNAVSNARRDSQTVAMLHVPFSSVITSKSVRMDST